MDKHSHAELIDALGGTGAVLRAMQSGLVTGMPEQISQEAISMWKARGIPHRWRPYMAAFAIREDVDLPEDLKPLLERPRKPRRRASAERTAS